MQDLPFVCIHVYILYIWIKDRSLMMILQLPSCLLWTLPYSRCVSLVSRNWVTVAFCLEFPIFIADSLRRPSLFWSYIQICAQTRIGPESLFLPRMSELYHINCTNTPKGILATDWLLLRTQHLLWVSWSHAITSFNISGIYCFPYKKNIF